MDQEALIGREVFSHLHLPASKITECEDNETIMFLF
jgi:hypothetical protein